MTKKQYEIWSEGFHVQEGIGHAKLFGTSEGDTFKDACIHLAESDPEFEDFFDEERLTYWGCRLFDNESDARRSFG